MNTNNGVKWRRFIVPKKVEQINYYLFIDTYKSNNIKIGVNDSEMRGRWKDEAWSIPEITVLRQPIGEYRLRRKGRVKEMGYQLLKEKRGWKISRGLELFETLRLNTETNTLTSPRLELSGRRPGKLVSRPRHVLKINISLSVIR